jgi:hypothetical protein
LHRLPQRKQKTESRKLKTNNLGKKGLTNRERILSLSSRWLAADKNIKRATGFPLLRQAQDEFRGNDRRRQFEGGIWKSTARIKIKK